MPNPIDDYNMGFNDGMRVDIGQARVTLQGKPPAPVANDDRIGHYNQGLYDAAKRLLEAPPEPPTSPVAQSMAPGQLRQTIQQYVGQPNALAPPGRGY